MGPLFQYSLLRTYVEIEDYRLNYLERQQNLRIASEREIQEAAEDNAMTGQKYRNYLAAV